MGLPPWETSDSQLFALITGVNSGLGYSIAARLVDQFLSSPWISPTKHLILILCTRSPMKTRFTISRLRAHLRKQAEYSEFATKQRVKAKAQNVEYNWMDTVQRVHFLGVEVDLCDLKSVYAVADKLVNGTVGSPDATTIDGLRLPHGSPGTQSFSEGVEQDRWALSQKAGSIGAQRSWGWGLSGIRIPRLDVVFLSAGTGAWTGVDWPTAIKLVLTDFIEALTYPVFKIARSGAILKRQSTLKSSNSDEARQPLLSEQKDPDEPNLGEVFCSNVFGHYILVHELMPLLSKPSSPSAKSGGKIVWVGSIDSLPEQFSLDDFQGLNTPTPYESSKRLVDYLAITSELPSVKPIADPYFDCSNTMTASKSRTQNDKAVSVKPKMYLTHPGVFVSDIFPLHFILSMLFLWAAYIARWFGSPWHTIYPYKGAVSAVQIALLDPESLEDAEGHGQSKCKWGSATDTRGAERVMKTEVPGWGWNGEIGEMEDLADEAERKSRRRGAVELTKEAREDFEITGGKCWAKMEELRKEWEDILGVGEEAK